MDSSDEYGNYDEEYHSDDEEDDEYGSLDSIDDSDLEYTESESTTDSYVYPWPTSSDDSWADISSDEVIQKILLKLPQYDPPDPNADLDKDSDEGGYINRRDLIDYLSSHSASLIERDETMLLDLRERAMKYHNSKGITEQDYREFMNDVDMDELDDMDEEFLLDRYPMAMESQLIQHKFIPDLYLAKVELYEMYLEYDDIDKGDIADNEDNGNDDKKVDTTTTTTTTKNNDTTTTTTQTSDDNNNIDDRIKKMNEDIEKKKDDKIDKVTNEPTQGLSQADVTEPENEDQSNNEREDKKAKPVKLVKISTPSKGETKSVKKNNKTPKTPKSPKIQEIVTKLNDDFDEKEREEMIARRKERRKTQRQTEKEIAAKIKSDKKKRKAAREAKKKKEEEKKKRR
eukprot:15285_1